MLLEKYCQPERDKHGRKAWWARLSCDSCSSVFQESWRAVLKKQKKRKEHLCKQCLDALMSQISSVRMKKTRMKQTPAERRRIASEAGKKSQATGTPAKTWFSRARWDSLPVEQQRRQVLGANSAAQDRLKAMTADELAEHYRKVMRGGIGFVSRGQQELEDCLKHLGFAGNQPIGAMTVDVFHSAKKIVVEFNGDAYHCNPKTWESDEYSTLIKMTAGQKWKKDIARYAWLRSQGYQVVVIWESDWERSREDCLNRVKEAYEAAP